MTGLYISGNLRTTISVTESGYSRQGQESIHISESPTTATMTYGIVLTADITWYAGLLSEQFWQPI